MRLIDWDKVLEWMHRQKETTEQWSMRIAIENYVDDMPTVEAEPIKHGKWLVDDETGDIQCSCCGHWSFDMYDEPFIIDGHKGIATIAPYYCGYCGAKMDEEGE